MIRTIYAEDQDVFILDQNLLPAHFEYIEIVSYQEMAQAIKTLKVRGAPLIGVAAAFGLFLAIKNFTGSTEDLELYYFQAEQLLASTRATAVNLFWAIDRMRTVFNTHKYLEIEALTQRFLQEAMQISAEDVATNICIGENGKDLLVKDARVLTVCNAGALATCGYGTALGVIRSAHKDNRLNQVYACETRPVLQG